jgi:[protein-PII] uridylyltransferase
MAPMLDRSSVIDDPTLAGLPLCRAYSDLVDRWMAALFAQAGAPTGVALLAVGGYGRAELSPQSDIDLLLLHEPKADLAAVAEVAEQIWYPIWDQGLKLGHAVRTVKEAVALASDDLDTATSLLSIRHLAGDHRLTDDLTGRRPVAQAGQAVPRRDQRAGQEPARVGG